LVNDVNESFKAPAISIIFTPEYLKVYTTFQKFGLGKIFQRFLKFSKIG